MPLIRPRRAAAVGLALALSAGLLLTSAPASADPPDSGDTPVPTAVPGRYIVTLADKPIASYEGDVKGYSATKPRQGRKVNTTSAGARRYGAYLKRQQDRAAARVGAKPNRRYDTALSAFTTSLTAAQARTLEKSPGVLAVTKDTARTLTDDKNSVDFWRLTGTGGVWSKLGGSDKAGRGVVTGIIDSGYWPESPSFAGDALQPGAPGSGDDAYAPYTDGASIKMKKSDGSTFVGLCQPGENAAANFTGAECNSKVVSARYFPDSYKQATPEVQRTDYLAARARDGHGSHVGSTAVGNAGVPVSLGGRSYGKISGVAPAAKMAVYKVCFTSVQFPDTTCYVGDSIAAIDQAVKDGVDVLNFSISSGDSLVDPVDLAFLNAATAGIFIAASAGNSGPGPSTVDHVVPWLTTVGASTVAPYAATAVLGNGKAYAGIGTTVLNDVGPAPLVRASLVRRAGVSVARSAYCAANTLDPAKTEGKIVVCDRGVNARVDKSDEVERAGGAGMVLVNLTDNSRDGDYHAVPTVHLNVPEALTVRAYSATKGAKVTLRRGNLSGKKIVYPQVAGFSSRGPSVGNGGDLLKPDVSGPGVAILAAVSPDTAEGRLFDFYSGTSMSSPHIAGAAALYYSRKPNWSPMAVKSALMTTSTRLKNADGSLNRDYNSQGSGNARPTKMFDPGLVFESGADDWLSYLEGSGVANFAEVSPVNPSNYNSPSIAIGKLVGTRTITRRVTAVEAGTYEVKVAVPGITAKVVTPKKVTLKVGQTATIKVSFRRGTAPLGETAFGSLFLTSKGATVRAPVAVTPQSANAPDTVAVTSGAAGSAKLKVTPGLTTRRFPISALGLDLGDVRQGEVSAATPTAVDSYRATVAKGTRVVRLSAESDAAAADIDLFVYQVVGETKVLVADSATGSGDEQVTLFDPEPGQYVVEVVPYADPAGQSSTTYEYRGFVVGPDLPNFSVSPAAPKVTNGRPFTLTASWKGLTAGRPYLGYIEYPGGTSGTFVEVN